MGLEQHEGELSKKQTNVSAVGKTILSVIDSFGYLACKFNADGWTP